jgi:hypothetical protein
MKVEFLKAPAPDQTHCSPFGGLEAIPWHGKEWRKFGGVVERKLRQLRPGAPNVVAIINDSTTHDSQEGPESMELYRERVHTAPEEVAGHAGLIVDQLRERWALLSAVVVFSSKWGNPIPPLRGGPNFVWRNADARMPLSERTRDCLRAMARP